MVEEMLAMTDDEDEEYPAEKTKGRGNDIDWFFLIQYETLELFNESAIMKEQSPYLYVPSCSVLDYWYVVLVLPSAYYWWLPLCCCIKP